MTTTVPPQVVGASYGLPEGGWPDGAGARRWADDGRGGARAPIRIHQIQPGQPVLPIAADTH